MASRREEGLRPPRRPDAVPRSSISQEHGEYSVLRPSADGVFCVPQDTQLYDVFTVSKEGPQLCHCTAVIFMYICFIWCSTFPVATLKHIVTLYDLCSILYDSCSTLYGLFSMLYDSCSMPYGSFSMLYDSCSMLYGSFSMLYDSCSMPYGSFSMLYDSCSMLYDSFSMLYDPCSMLYGSFSMLYDLRSMLYDLRSILLSRSTRTFSLLHVKIYILPYVRSYIFY